MPNAALKRPLAARRRWLFPRGRDFTLSGGAPRRRVSSCAGREPHASRMRDCSAESRRLSSVGQAGGAGRAALWLRPGEWLLRCAEGGESGRALSEVMESRARREPPTASWMSRIARSALSRPRPAAGRTLNAGCPLDLHVKAFQVGMATRTLFDKAEIVLWRRAATMFQVEVWRSFAPYLAVSLAEAARGAPEW